MGCNGSERLVMLFVMEFSQICLFQQPQFSSRCDCPTQTISHEFQSHFADARQEEPNQL